MSVLAVRKTSLLKSVAFRFPFKNDFSMWTFTVKLLPRYMNPLLRLFFVAQQHVGCPVHLVVLRKEEFFELFL